MFHFVNIFLLLLLLIFLFIDIVLPTTKAIVKSEVQPFALPLRERKSDLKVVLKKNLAFQVI